MAIHVNYKKGYNQTVYFNFKKDYTNEAHAVLIDLLCSLDFNESIVCSKLDISLESCKDVYYFLSSEKYMFNLFISDELIHVVFHSKDKPAKDNLVKQIRKHFDY